MKRLKLIAAAYQGSGVPVGILWMVMTLSLLLITLVIGQYRFSAFAVNTLKENKALENTYYVMQFGKAPGEAAEQSNRALIEKFMAQPAAGNVVRTQYGYFDNNGRRDTVLLYTEELMEIFHMDGLRPSLRQRAKQAAPDAYPCVTGGEFGAQRKAGDTFELKIDGTQPYPLKLAVARSAGKQAYAPALTISMSSGGELNANAFFSPANSAVVYSDPALLKALEENGSLVRDVNFFVVLNPGAAREQKEACLALLREQGSLISMEQVLKTSETQLHRQLLRSFPLPLFLLAVSGILLVSVCVLLIHKKSYDTCIYYLCGCSRRRAFWNHFLSIALIAAVAFGINLLFITVYPALSSSGALDFGGILLDGKSVGYSLCFLVPVLLFSQLLGGILLKRLSLIEAVRRMET